MLKGDPVSVVEMGRAAGDRSQGSPQNPLGLGCAQSPSPGRGGSGCWRGGCPRVMLPHGAKICSRLQADSSQFLFLVPPMSPVQKSWEFILAGALYALSQKTSFFSCKWHEMFQKKG